MFDEDNLLQHCCKVLIIFGSRFGFRGKNEHYTLELHQVGHGFFPDDHPLWPGLEWYGIIDWGTFKTHHLNMETDYVHIDEYTAKFPVLSDGKGEGDVANDAGGAIGRWLEKLRKFESLNPTPEKQRTRFFRRVTESKIYVNSHLGENSIDKLFKYAFELMGVSNWKKVSAHASRHWFITVLANCPHVNLEEVRAAARHATPAMTVTYMAQSRNSVMQRVLALSKGGGVAGGQSEPSISKSGIFREKESGIAENEFVAPTVTLDVAPRSASSSSEESQRGAPDIRAVSHPRSVAPSSVTPICNPYAKRAVSKPQNDFKSPPRVRRDMLSEGEESPLKLRGRACVPEAVASSPARLKVAPMTDCPPTPKSYRDGPVWLSQFDCSPDRKLEASRTERPFSEATQNEYTKLQDSIDSFRAEKAATDRLLQKTVSHRQQEIRRLRAQIEDLRKNEARRQKYLGQYVMSGTGPVVIGDKQRKIWKREEEVYNRTLCNSQYRLTRLEDAYADDRERLERFRQEKRSQMELLESDLTSGNGGRDTSWSGGFSRESGSRDRPWSGGYASGNTSRDTPWSSGGFASGSRGGSNSNWEHNWDSESYSSGMGGGGYDSYASRGRSRSRDRGGRGFW